MFIIGVGTAVIAVAINISIEEMADWKYSFIKTCILFVLYCSAFVIIIIDSINTIIYCHLLPSVIISNQH